MVGVKNFITGFHLTPYSERRQKMKKVKKEKITVVVYEDGEAPFTKEVEIGKKCRCTYRQSVGFEIIGDEDRYSVEYQRGKDGFIKSFFVFVEEKDQKEKGSYFARATSRVEV